MLLELKEFDVLKRLDPQLAASGQSQVQPSTEGAATAHKSTTSKDESRKPRQGTIFSDSFFMIVLGLKSVATLQNTFTLPK